MPVKPNTQNINEELLDWGLSQSRIEEAPSELLFSLTRKMSQLGLEPGLVTACIRTPHPQLDMLVFRWRPLKTEEVPTTGTKSILGQRTNYREDGVQDIYYMVRGHTDEGIWKTSPFYRVLTTNALLRVPLSPEPKNPPFPIIEDLIERGMTDYLVIPLKTERRVNMALSVATSRQGGFPQEFLNALDLFIPLLSLSAAIKVERIQFKEVLSAYIGKEPAELVFQGQIHRGDTISRESALGFIDLRGFTEASEKLPMAQFLEMVNTFFEYVHQAVTNGGGEILKFMGDAVLFFFPTNETPNETCDRALDAVKSLTEAIDDRNQKTDKHPLYFGCGLHYGTVLYGNIGTAARLDFTVMGQAVNLTSRLENLTGRIKESCLVSAEFAKLTKYPARFVGNFDLKGIKGTQQVYSPFE
ncbi:MAG: adenylate/guanylate cyclase domain-containing protein [Myxococcota bacterium]|nr:adenylate/guanylate cyclase domain-containing protein [Myxococcota bacterium]